MLVILVSYGVLTRHPGEEVGEKRVRREINRWPRGTAGYTHSGADVGWRLVNGGAARSIITGGGKFV